MQLLVVIIFDIKRNVVIKDKPVSFTPVLPTISQQLVG